MLALVRVRRECVWEGCKYAYLSAAAITLTQGMCEHGEVQHDGRPFYFNNTLGGPVSSIRWGVGVGGGAAAISYLGSSAPGSVVLVETECMNHSSSPYHARSLSPPSPLPSPSPSPLPSPLPSASATHCLIHI